MSKGVNDELLTCQKELLTMSCLHVKRCCLQGVAYSQKVAYKELHVKTVAYVSKGVAYMSQGVTYNELMSKGVAYKELLTVKGCKLTRSYMSKLLLTCQKVLLTCHKVLLTMS